MKDYNITDKDYKKISKELLKYFGTDIYMACLSNLHFEKITEDALILSCNNNFIIDTINKNYLNGVKRKINNKYVLIKKGIKQVVEKVRFYVKGVGIAYGE